MKTIELTDRVVIADIMDRCSYCMLGLVDEAGKPYVLPMNFAWDGDYIYLHSGAEGKKVDLLEQSPVACLTFCDGAELVWMHREMACSYSMKSRSVIVRGKVSAILDLDEKRRALMLLMRHFTEEALRMSDVAVRNVRVWRVEVEEMTARSFGLRPSEL